MTVLNEDYVPTPASQQADRFLSERLTRLKMSVASGPQGGYAKPAPNNFVLGKPLPREKHTIALPPVGSQEIWVWDTGKNNFWYNVLASPNNYNRVLDHSTSSGNSSAIDSFEFERNFHSPWLYLPLENQQLAKLRLSFHWVTVPSVDLSGYEATINHGEIQLRLMSEPNGVIGTGDQVLFEIFSDVVRYPRTTNPSPSNSSPRHHSFGFRKDGNLDCNGMDSGQDRYQFCKKEIKSWIEHGPLLTKRLSITHLSNRQSIGLCSINPSIRNNYNPPIFGLRTKISTT